MLDYFKNLSFNTIAFSAIIIGLIAILLYDPPKTICDAEIERFKLNNLGFLYINPKATVKKVQFHPLYEQCQKSNSPGGCVELFQGLRKMILQMNSVTEGCYKKLGELREVRGSVFRTLTLMSKLAWGSQPPQHVNLRAGFFDPSDINIFCALKQKAILIYGEEEWLKFQNQSLASLPGASLISREELWQKSLFSVSCVQYL